MRITPGDQLLNARLASEIGPQLTPTDRRDIANHWGVSIRTVERWFALGRAQQIAFVHSGRADRREWARILLDGYDAGQGVGQSTLDSVFPSITKAVDYGTRFSEGRLSPFLAQQGRVMMIYKRGGNWIVEYTYDPYPRRRRRR